MSLPTSEPVPFPEDELPPARRRRQKRLVLPDFEDEQARFLDEIGLRLTPGLDFFLSALLSGAVLGLAQLLDSPALVMLAALLAPFMGPALGPALAAAAGSARYLLRSLGWLLSAGLIYLLTGSLGGIASQIFPPASAAQAAAHLRLDWADVLLLSVGVVVTCYLLVRSPRRMPQLSSVAVAYTLMFPLGAAGYALTGGLGGSWWDGLAVFAAYLAWTALCGTLTLIVIGLRPRTTGGYTLGAAYLAVCLAAALILLFTSPAVQALGMPVPQAPQIAFESGEATRTLGASPSAGADAPEQPTSSPSAAHPTREPTQATATTKARPSADAAQPQAPTPSQTPGNSTTVTPTRTLVPTHTPTITVTPQATPVWARINAQGGDGAFIRVSPEYSAEIVVALLNGVIVEVLPDVVISEGVTWVKVRATSAQEGWIVRSLLATATPAPAW